MSDQKTEAAERAYELYRRKRGVSGPHARWVRRDFLVGFGSRIGDRLELMAKERRQSRAARDGANALVPIKSALIDSYVDETYGEIKNSRKSTFRRKLNWSHVNAGATAASAINLSRPIETDDAEWGAISGGEGQ